MCRPVGTDLADPRNFHSKCTAGQAKVPPGSFQRILRSPGTGSNREGETDTGRTVVVKILTPERLSFRHPTGVGRVSLGEGKFSGENY